MSQNPTIPPAPKRPPAKPPKFPTVTEQDATKVFRDVMKSYHPHDPYRGINQVRSVEQPKRHHTPSEVDITTARHDEQIKGLGRHLGTIEDRVTDLEDVAKSVDSKLDKISDTLTAETHARKLEEATKEEVKVLHDQKTKRFQALLAAIPIILAPILGFYGSYMSKPAPDYKTDTVVISNYTQESADCLKKFSKNKTAFITCIREAQLKNTPNFEE